MSVVAEIGSIQGIAVRVTRLDSGGAPITGDGAFAVSDGFIQLQISPQVSKPKEWRQRLPSGRYVPQAESQVVVEGVQCGIEFCQVDPAMHELITGARTIVDHNGDIVGNAVQWTQTTRHWFALEVWSLRPNPVDENLWTYWLVPCLSNGAVGDMTIEDAVGTFQMMAVGWQNPAWGVGPYNVVRSAFGTAGRLNDPVTADDVLYTRATSIAPPGSLVGYQVL